MKVDNGVHLFLPIAHEWARNGRTTAENRIRLIKLTRNKKKKRKKKWKYRAQLEGRPILFYFFFYLIFISTYENK